MIRRELWYYNYSIGGEGTLFALFIRGSHGPMIDLFDSHAVTHLNAPLRHHLPERHHIRWISHSGDPCHRFHHVTAEEQGSLLALLGEGKGHVAATHFPFRGYDNGIVPCRLAVVNIHRINNRRLVCAFQVRRLCPGTSGYHDSIKTFLLKSFDSGLLMDNRHSSLLKLI